MAARLIQYDIRLPLFLCRLCGNHIALDSDYAWPDSRYGRAIFLNVVNVLEFGYYSKGTNTVANVHCSGCNNILGIKFIEVQNNYRCLRAGTFELNLINLYFWDGNWLCQYDRHSPLFLCRFCGMHIASHTLYVCLNSRNGKAIFPSGLNLQTGRHCYNRREDTNRVANVRCSRCNNILGIKFIVVRNNSHGCVRAGRFELNMTKLLFWDGNLLRQIVA